ncbi:MAG: STAS domain-containing protein [Gammaproteobacteria bacterium]|nr:STAS domain-containing protein [Gammaproteobacteria bacterium]
MMAASLTATPDGGWQLAGDLDFNSVPDIWDRLAPLVEQRHELSLSLREVGRTNSAALALLVEALDHARRHGCRLQFSDLPADLLDLARMSRCDTLLQG